jgi:D-3-phosphoglycerate dehydrogenase
MSVSACTDHDGLKVLPLENIHPAGTELLSGAGRRVEVVAGALDEADFADRVADVGLLGICSTTRVTAKVLAAAPRLLSVGAFCIGTNQIDLPAASERGVAVFNAPFSNTRSVVEMALTEIVAPTRRLPEKNARMHAGVWDKSAAGSHEVRGRRLGIVG